MLDQTSQQPHLAALPPVSSVCAESPSLQRCWTLSYPNLQVLRSPLCHSQNQTAAHPIRRRCLPDTGRQRKTLCGKRGGAALLLWFLQRKMACLCKRTGKYMNEVHLDARSEIRIRTSARFCPWGMERAFVHFPGWSRCTFVTLSMHFCGGSIWRSPVYYNQGWSPTKTIKKGE